MVDRIFNGWPAKYADTDAAARCLAYLMAVVAAMSVAFGPVNHVGRGTSPVGLDALAWLVMVSGGAAAVGTIFRRWQTELVAVYGLTAGMLVYTCADWLVMLFVEGYPPVLMAGLAIGAGMLVFSAVSTGKRRWRWAALACAAVVVGLAVPLNARNPAIMTLSTALLFSRAVGLTVFRRQTVEAQSVHPPGGNDP
jgi:hypothetical protein